MSTRTQDHVGFDDGISPPFDCPACNEIKYTCIMTGLDPNGIAWRCKLPHAIPYVQYTGSLLLGRPQLHHFTLWQGLIVMETRTQVYGGDVHTNMGNLCCHLGGRP